MKLTRRQFLKGSAVALGMPTIIPASALGMNGTVAPSNRIVLGGIGIGPRGREDLSAFLKQPDVQFVMIADVQSVRQEVVRVMVNRRYNNQDCAKTRDMFEVLGRPDIDAVLIATGDHWHALATILSVKAGKDVYCEKPCSMTIRESQELADAVNRYGRVFQAGTQRRNVDNFRFAAELARSGRLGRIHTVHASILPLEESHEWLPGEPEPGIDKVDWDRWLGPAPVRPYNSVLSPRGVHNHYPNWRASREFGGGMVTDWGAHHLDIAQWGLGMDESGPVAARPPEEADAKRGATLVYANGVTVKHVNGFGVHFHGADGEVLVNRGKFVPIRDGQELASYRDNTNKDTSCAAEAA